MVRRTMLALLLCPALLLAQDNKHVEAWHPFEFFVGSWQGKGDGKFGVATVERHYEFIMGGTYLLAKNRSVYEKQEKNPEGEIHDNWDFFSYDRGSKKFRLRQFHAEEIVVQSAVDSAEVAGGGFHFASERIENWRPGWRAVESYKILNDDEFVETFSLGGPDQELEVYITTHFRRKR